MWNLANTRLDPMRRAAAVAMAVVAISIFPRDVIAAPTVVSFDDLPGAYCNLTANGYAGLTWEQGNISGDTGNLGYWLTVDQLRNGHPHSQPLDVTNGEGCTLIGIGFPNLVDMSGGYVAVQGNGSNRWATGLRVHGYLAGQEVGSTDWFTTISTTPVWFDMSTLPTVDRIVFESVSATPGVGVYGLDDLTFTYVPEPAGLAAVGFAAAALLARRRAGGSHRVE